MEKISLIQSHPIEITCFVSINKRSRTLQVWVKLPDTVRHLPLANYPWQENCGLQMPTESRYSLRRRHPLGGSFGGGGFLGGNGGILSSDEKLTMQSLNERLAAYLGTVRNLEMENAQLEQLIREWYQKQGPTGTKDYSHYYGKIEDLQNQLVTAAVETNRVLLDLDNTRMTAEDFRIK
uniref:IF rod domain-containing protein n=1 Tax=Athene cunicularia TaxID=194338 RepID=A0A663MM88_ATHCN